MKLTRLAVWDHCAKRWSWNCQGWQFEDQKPKIDEKGPWNCQGWQFKNVAVKLRSVHKKSVVTFSNCLIWQVCPTDYLTRLESKVFILERLFTVCIRKKIQKNFRSEKYFVSENNFQKKFGSEKFWSEKKFCLKKFWFKNFFGTNKIFGLKILGPKKFWIWKKNWG